MNRKNKRTGAVHHTTKVLVGGEEHEFLTCRIDWSEAQFPETGEPVTCSACQEGRSQRRKVYNDLYPAQRQVMGNLIEIEITDSISIYR